MRTLAALDGTVLSLERARREARRRYIELMATVFPGLAQAFVLAALDAQLSGTIDGGLPRNHAVAFRDAYRRIAEGFDLEASPEVEAQITRIAVELHRGPFTLLPGGESLLSDARKGETRLAICDQGDPSLLRAAAAAIGIRAACDLTHFNVRLTQRDLDLVESLFGEPDVVLTSDRSALRHLARARGWHVLPSATRREVRIG